MHDRGIELRPGVLVMVKPNAKTIQTGNAGRTGTILHWANNGDILTVPTATGERLQLRIVGSGWLVRAAREFNFDSRSRRSLLPVLQLCFFASSLVPIAGPAAGFDIATSVDRGEGVDVMTDYRWT